MPTRVKYDDLVVGDVSAPTSLRISYDDLEPVRTTYERSFDVPFQATEAQPQFAFEQGEQQGRDWTMQEPVNRRRFTPEQYRAYEPFTRGMDMFRAEDFIATQAEMDKLPLGEAVLSAFNAAPREFIGLLSGAAKGIALSDEELTRIGLKLSGGEYVAAPEQHLAYRIGAAIDEATKSLFPHIPRARGSFAFETLPGGAGQMAGFVASGGLARAFLKYGPEVVAILLGSGLEATEVYEAARRDGVSQDDASILSRLGLPIGALELLGIPRIIKAFGGSKQIGQVLKQALAGGIENLTQETLQTGLENAVAGVHGNRELLAGVGEAGGAGGILGALMTFGSAYLGMRLRNKLRKARVDAYKAQRATQRIQKALQTPLTPQQMPVGQAPETRKTFTKAEILTPQGAGDFAQLYPTEAAAIAAKEKPSRTDMPDVMATGERLTAPERAQLSKLLRERSQPPTEAAPEAVEPPVPRQEPSSEEETPQGQAEAQAPVLEPPGTLGPSPRTAETPATLAAPPDRLTEIRQRREDAKKRLAALSVGGAPGAGPLDPRMFREAVNIGLTYIEEGIVHIEEFTKALVADIGDWIKPHANDIFKAAHDEFGVPPNTIPPDSTSIAAGTTEVKPPETVGLNLAQYEIIGNQMDLEAMPPVERRRWVSVLAQARSEGLTGEAADALASELIANPRVVEDTEHAALVLRVAELINDYKTNIADQATAIQQGDTGQVGALKERGKTIIGKIEGMTKAAKYSGTAIARALNIHKLLLNLDTYEIANVLSRAQANKTSQLTEAETNQLTELQKSYDDLKTRFEAQHEQYQVELADAERRAAEAIANRDIDAGKRRAKTTKRIAEIRDKRADLYKQLAALGYQVNVGADPKALWLMGQLAKTYFDEGAVSLDDVVQRMTEHLPDITARDVWQSLMMSDPDQKKKAESEARKFVREAKKEANILQQVEDAMKGIFKEGRKPGEITNDIKAVKKTLAKLRSQAYKSGRERKSLEAAVERINKLQDQLANGQRAQKKVRGEIAEDLKLAREKIKELTTEMRLTDQKADYEEQLRTKEFKIKPKKPIKRLPPRLERLQVEVNQARKKIDRAIEDMKPKGKLGLFKETTDLLRQIKATADMSYTLRQLAFFTVFHPRKALDAHINGVKAFFSQNSADAIQATLVNHPMHYLRVGRMGIQFSELDDPSVRGEEYYHSKVINWFERKFPKLGQVFRSSSRHATVASNMFRAALADEFMHNYPNATDEELKAYGDVINKGTGVGNIGTGALADILPYAFFAPKFAASRFQTPLALAQYWHLPRVRAEIAKNLIADTATGLSILTLAAMAGAKVGLDPEDPDFGKIVIGNQHIDIWAGFQQPFRLATRIMMKLSGTSESKQSILEMFGRYSAYKAAPALSLAYELSEGKTLVGEKISKRESIGRSFVPLILEELYDAARTEGFGAAAFSAPLNFYGVGVNTYVKDAAARSSGRPSRPRRPARPSRY